MVTFWLLCLLQFQLQLDTRTLTDGPHVLSVEGRDAAGKIYTDSITIFVDNRIRVSFISPTDKVSVSKKVDIEVKVFSVAGLLSRASIDVDGNQLLLADSINKPEAVLKVAWNTSPSGIGKHQIAVHAKDSTGRTITKSINVDVIR